MAAAAPAGQEFDQWTGDVANVGDVNVVATSITLPPASGALGFDPLSISAVPVPVPPVASLPWQWNSVAGGWELVWEGDSWVLQNTAEHDARWSDVSAPASSPYVVIPEEPLQFFRLREAGPE